MKEQVLTPQQPMDQDLNPSPILNKTFTDHVLVTTEEQFWTLEDHLDKAGIFAYDSETNGTFDRFAVQAVGLSFATGDYSCYLPFGHHDGSQLSIDFCLPRLERYFVDETKAKICHNAKFDEMVLSRYDIDVTGPGHDTLIMAWLLSETSTPKGLKHLVFTELGYQMETYEEVVNSAKKRRGVDRDYNFARVSLEDALSYAADDSYWVYRLFFHFKEKLEKQKLWDAYENVEMPFSRVLRKMEARGVYIDQDYLKEADTRLPQIIEEIDAAIYEEAGEVFNIKAGKQLGEILFEKLGIGKDVPKTKSGQYCTDKHTLELYAAQYPIVENVLRRKKIQKTHSTFVKGTREFIARDHKVHPSFHGNGTVTGRLSCSAPNLQQIEGDEVEEIKVRDFFIPSPGYSFVIGDYGQIELRVMAHLAKDQTAINAFLSGKDFHDETARSMFKLGPDTDVLHRQRFAAKALNFGIPYGRGCYSVGAVLGINPKCKYYVHLDEELTILAGRNVWRKQGEVLKEPCEECAQCFIEKWWLAFPDVKALKEKTLARGRAQGFVRTMSGRKRRLPDINSTNKQLKARAERQAFNTVIQGSAADIIKLAMNSLQLELPKLDAHLNIQIHDELVVEAPTDAAEEVLATMKRVMENPVNGKNPLRLPLIVDPKIVMKWGDAK